MKMDKGELKELAEQLKAESREEHIENTTRLINGYLRRIEDYNTAKHPIEVFSVIGKNRVMITINPNYKPSRLSVIKFKIRSHLSR